MRNVITAKDIEALLRSGGSVSSLPTDALLTPSARDLVREAEAKGSSRPGPTAASAASAPMPAPPAKPLNSRSPKAELEAFFQSPYCQSLKQQICSIGRRLWQREYVDGNGGNISYRIGANEVLCTPTLVSKGFMTPEDMCLVDFEGRQLFGTKKRTSEILMHLQMMKQQPKDMASVHCHPPFATAYAVAGLEPPTCMVPEYEVFCAVAVAPYRTPGTPEMGKLVADLVDKHNTILMANHGVVTWSHNNVEEAYWRMEIVEAYCRTLTVAAQLGKPLNTFTPGQLKDLLNIKQGLGFVDPRYGLKECELCDNSEWRPGAQCPTPNNNGSTPAAPPPDPETERLVQMITERIMERLGK